MYLAKPGKSMQGRIFSTLLSEEFKTAGREAAVLWVVDGGAENERGWGWGVELKIGRRNMQGDPS